MRVFIVFICLVLAACGVSKNPQRKEVRGLLNGTVKDDTSFVYALPYKQGKSFRVIQGYFSHFSHKERAALDFNMKRGTGICAARGGVVIRVKEDGDRGGLNKKYRPYGNNIVIEHSDSTRAGYWHLQKDGALVQVGDTVKQGQLISLSGKTGYAAVPHLHFLVWKSNGKGNWQQIPTRFKTSKGIKYLHFWKKYKNV
ncbi:M23 family metallopeptidase [Ferruginibacter sp. HRS2-29]|uniref:M23 family metallopeptidase n=1 Tax=Ferruginibacter sp. HRS2-29 TaxID=2487334 RepID=UPI0020CF813B|nr:M23 family metallopeptidase [Ferruginibacter sp. HRS2-29]MCP9753106.1 M23 family metallopeptidase [Ferruginibacter sp. HRS2-29]